MKIIKLLYSEDAVSEVVDFVTILGILVFFIGIIGVAGYPMVKNAQDANNIENTKQSFIVLAANINKIVLGQTPSQSVELKVYGGTLSVNGSSTINITAIDSTGNNVTLVYTTQMRSIESTVGNTVIAYEGTGVWAKYPGGNTLLVSKPLITNRSNVLVIPVVTMLGTSSIGGYGISRVTASGAPGVILYRNVSNITVNISSSYWNGWKTYFGNVMFWQYCISSESSGSCTVKLATTNNIDVYILNIQLNTGIV
ncbi:MAG: hypothetical protein ABOK23_12300 [Candidatus Methanoperedens sp.]|nr:hypothetical protein [Candidatus Methanoperedens sp.]MCZ7396611.1 hypothetical protein [Candidatus Methanoperedens sp.]